jgi:hypothetical protein
MMSEQFALLSTSDNPYNPHTEWDDWYMWDLPRYSSLALLGRVIVTSDELPVALQHEAYEEAVNIIVTENVSGVHIKVDSPKPKDESA